MRKTAFALTIWFALALPLHPQSSRQVQQQACMDACMLERPDPDLQRQELVTLEKEAARAIQFSDATFFRRVYSDDFSGVLSRGQPVDRSAFIVAIQSTDVKYDSFTASDIKVRLYRDIAVATSTWSMRATLKGQRVSSQMRTLHVYLYSGGGYHVISGQVTGLPPYLDLPL
jgi:hypothetical protein